MNLLSNKNRSFINVIGIPIIVSSIYFSFLFPFMITVMLYFCSLEYVKLANRLGAKINSFFLVSLNAIIFINLLYGFIDFLSILTIIFVLLFANEILFSNKADPINCAYYFIGIFWIGYALSGCLYQIRSLEHGVFFTFMLFLGIWMCDTFAYLFGSKFGKRKILEQMSPNKTYVGSFAGLIGSLIVLSIFHYSNYYYSINIDINLFDLCALTIILGVFGQIGDFSESLFKRKAGIKDTSTVLMGHGGFLDRFDSISFAAPLFYLYIEYFII